MARAPDTPQYLTQPLYRRAGNAARKDELKRPASAMAGPAQGSSKRTRITKKAPKRTRITKKTPPESKAKAKGQQKEDATRRRRIVKKTAPRCQHEKKKEKKKKKKTKKEEVKRFRIVGKTTVQGKQGKPERKKKEKCATTRKKDTRLSYCRAVRTQLMPELTPRLQPERNSARLTCQVASGWQPGRAATFGNNCVLNVPQYQSLADTRKRKGDRHKKTTSRKASRHLARKANKSQKIETSWAKLGVDWTTELADDEVYGPRRHVCAKCRADKRRPRQSASSFKLGGKPPSLKQDTWKCQVWLAIMRHSACTFRQALSQLERKGKNLCSPLPLSGPMPLYDVKTCE